MNPHRGGTSATVAWAKTTKFRVERVSPAAGKAIMLVLADYADQSWSCWLGQQAIAEMADIGERTVRRFLAGAQEAGWLCVVSRTRKEAKGQGRGRGADRLYLHVDGDRSACPQCIDLPEDLAGNSEGLTGHPGHDLPATQGQKPRATPLIPEPAKEPATSASDESSLFTDNNGSAAGGSHEKDPDYGFEKFWAAYPARKGHKLNKAKAIPIWRKLTYDEKAEAWRGAKAMAAVAEADDFFAPDAFRWLRDRAWPEWLETPDAEPELDPLYNVR